MKADATTSSTTAKNYINTNTNVHFSTTKRTYTHTDTQTLMKSDSYLASVGLYVTSYLSTGIACWSTDVCHDIFTEVGFKNVTVIFSGAADIEPNPSMAMYLPRESTNEKYLLQKLFFFFEIFLLNFLSTLNKPTEFITM